MRKQFFGSAIAIVVGVGLVFLAPGSAAGQYSQVSQAAAKVWDPPRTPDGQPDIQGFWEEEAGGADGTNVETSLQQAAALKIQGMSDAAIAARKPVSAIIDTPDGKIPYQPWAEARRRQILTRYGGDELTGKPETVRDINPDVSCVLGMPRLAYWVDFQVVQTPGYVVMAWERTHAFRVIPLDGRPHVAPGVKLFMGDARGHWEGNTLVVSTTNLKDWTWFDSKGTLHTDALTMVERYTFADAKKIDYRVTFQDPKALTRPFTMAWTLHRTHAPAEAYELMEYACSEGERALKLILEK